MSLQTRITAIMFKTFHPVKISCFITTDAPRSDRVSSTVLWVVKHSIKLYLFILFSLTNALPSESYTSKLDFPVYNTLPSHPALSVCCFAYLCLFLIAASLRCDIHLQLHVLGRGSLISAETRIHWGSGESSLWTSENVIKHRHSAG